MLKVVTFVFLLRRINDAGDDCADHVLNVVKSVKPGRQSSVLNPNSHETGL